MGYLPPDEQALERREVGDVAAHELHGGQLFAAHDELRAPPVGLQVQSDDPMTLAHELATAPRADAAERARDHPALTRHCRPVCGADARRGLLGGQDAG